MKKEAVAARPATTKQSAASQRTVSENKSVVGSKKGPAATSKSLAPQTRQWVWLLVCLGIIAILVVIALIIGLVFLTKSSGSDATSASTTTTVAPTPAPVVCRDGQGGGVKDDCVIPSSSCNQHCIYYNYEWPLKNISIKNGSFNGAMHVCQKGSVRGRCNAGGNCETGGINSNMQGSSNESWLDNCDQPNPCWDNASLKTINEWVGKGVLNLTECSKYSTAHHHCQPKASVVLSIQHRQCESGKHCDGRPFRVWKCTNCIGVPPQPFPSCQGQANGVKCNTGNPWYCLGQVCVQVDGDVPAQIPGCGK